MSALRGLFFLSLGILFVFQLFEAIIDLSYGDRFLPGLKIASLSIGGKEREAAWVALAPQLTAFAKTPLILHYGDLILSKKPLSLGFATSKETALKPASNFGREGFLPWRVKNKLQALFSEREVGVGWKVDEQGWDGFLSSPPLLVLEREPKDAAVVIASSRVRLEKAVVGRKIEKELLLTQIKKRLTSLSGEPILIPLTETPPQVSDAEALSAQSLIEKEFTRSLLLKTVERSFRLEKEELWQMIEVVSRNGELKADLSENKLRQYLLSLEPAINQERQNPQLVLEQDRAALFIPPRNEVRLLLGESITQIKDQVKKGEREIELITRVREPEFSLSSTNDWGIVELVARGTSNFKGSPPNRRHNIKVGVARFNGLMIKSGDTFSFLKALGRVDSSTGYLPELVIKGDKTVPEFGGGLCQVSTTAFRAILNGGYPVRERKNHSYRVVYYEPAGSDATIYPPRPDLKFTNDLPGAILIHSYLQGDDAFFDFYGTPLKRKVVLDGPHILRTTGIPAPLYLETSALPPGQIKRVDVAHPGAKTVLYRYLYDQSGGLIRKDTFESNYIPWPAKYLVGKKEAPALEADLKQTPSEKEAEEKEAEELSPAPSLN